MKGMLVIVGVMIICVGSVFIMQGLREITDNNSVGYVILVAGIFGVVFPIVQMVTVRKWLFGKK